MKNKIAVKLSLYFSAVLLALAIIVGMLFILLFQNYTLSAHKKDMATRAGSIALAFSEYLSNGTSGMMGYGRGGMGMAGFGGYLKFIDDIAGTPVWVVDENLNFFTGAASGSSYNIADLPADAEIVVREAFEGGTTFSEGFSGLFNTPTLTVGTPVAVNGDIIGAVLLHDSFEGISSSANQGIIILVISIAAALVITVIMSYFLAAKMTGPLKSMMLSTARLASGDYTAKTGVQRNDEIGALAGSIDALSDTLEEARRATDKLERLRRDFVANVSHELRTPITVLRGSLEALHDGIVTKPEQVKNYYSQMLGEVLFLQRLVNDLMDLSRLQNTEFSIDKTDVNIADILSDAVRSAAQLAGPKSVDIRFDVETQALSVCGDYSRLRQMFLVVLDNAVKFSPPGGVVDVSLSNGRVTIKDKGPGIPEEDVKHIFDRFYKVKSEDNKTGSGLGLAIAKQIADRHGIKTDVYSTVGHGTDFVFTITSG